MRTLWSSGSVVSADNYWGTEGKAAVSLNNFQISEILGRKEIRFLSSPKEIGISLQHKGRNYPVFVSSLSLSSATQEELPDEQAQIQGSKDTLKTVNVKFQLQRKCAFGEQFSLLGDDPILGSWDPLSAIPLDWSEGDIWTVELDLPIEKLIQFKFILKKVSRDIAWQPGPNRTVQTWKTMKTISVSEDWEDPELQMILEEDLAHHGDEILKSELIAAENFVDPKKENTMNMNDGERSVSDDSRPVGSANSEKPEDDEKCVSYEGVPVLVPGLAPLATIDTDNTPLSEINNQIADNSSSGDETLEHNAAEVNDSSFGDETLEHNAAEVNDSSSGDETLEHNAAEPNLKRLDPETKSPHSKDSTPTMIHVQVEEHGGGPAMNCSSPEEERDRASLKPIETVFENDAQWGHSTLQKLLGGFGLF